MLATDNVVERNLIGTDVTGRFAVPNGNNGIRVTSRASGNLIGGTATGGNNTIRTCLVAGNFGNGIVIAGKATGDTVEDTAAGTDSAIEAAIPNYGSGILISGNAKGTVIAANTVSGSGSNGLLLNAATNLLVGGSGDGVANTIVTSVGYGLLAVGSCSRTQVIRNLISGNTQGDVSLSASTGITYVP